MLTRAQNLREQLVQWRRDIHMHPELGFEETRTSSLVAGVLQSLGYRVRTGVGRTGVVAERGSGHPIVVIRADMDALPIQEENDVPYASQAPGVMHACGHDAHTAIAMGVATMLAQETFAGTLRLVFQPAEEVADAEGLSGASRMIEDGALEGMDAALALHVHSNLAAGDVSVEAGPASAGVDTLYATIIGRGGHGAQPHQTVDPIFLAAHVVLALHGISSRRVDPFEPSVITVGSIHGGEVSNVIPDRVQIEATIRYREPEVQKLLHAEIVRALEVAKVLGGDYEHRFEIGYPPMHNHGEITSLLSRVAIDLLGNDHLKPGLPTMGAEDFGYFTAQAPGAMFSLGCGIEGDPRMAHNPLFDINENCLPVGAAILAEAALRLLKNNPA